MAQDSLSTGLRLLGLVSTILLTCGVGTPEVSANEGTGSKHGGGKTIVLTATHTQGNLGLATEIKEPSTTNGVGDRLLFSDDLRYQKNGELAGRNSAVCTTTSPFGNPPDIRPAHRGAQLCTLGFELIGRGKITVSGIITDENFAAGVFVLPIVGGTGEFHNARGEYEVLFTLPATLTFRLQ